VLHQVLRDLKVADAASRRFRVMESDQPLRRLSQLRLQDDEAKRGADWVLICRGPHWLGWVDDQPLRDLPVQQWDLQTVGDHLRPLESLPSVADSAPIWQAINVVEASDQGRALVLSPAGLPAGTVDRMDIAEAVLKRLGVRLPPPILDEARRHNRYPMGLVMLPQIVESMAASSEPSDRERAST
jgi:hypothetical protein